MYVHTVQYSTLPYCIPHIYIPYLRYSSDTNAHRFRAVVRCLPAKTLGEKYNKLLRTYLISHTMTTPTLAFSRSLSSFVLDAREMALSRRQLAQYSVALAKRVLLSTAVVWCPLQWLFAPTRPHYAIPLSWELSHEEGWRA